MKLPSELKTKVNKMAHAAGVAHGEQVKLRLLAEIERRLAAGESAASLSEYLKARTCANVCSP